MAISTFGINRIQDTDGLYILEYYPSTDASGASISAIKTSNSDIWDLVKEIRPQSETQEKIVLASNAMVLKNAPELTTIDYGGFDFSNININSLLNDKKANYPLWNTPKLTLLKNLTAKHLNSASQDVNYGDTGSSFAGASTNNDLIIRNFHITGSARSTFQRIQAKSLTFENSTLNITSDFNNNSEWLFGGLDNLETLDASGLTITTTNSMRWYNDYPLFSKSLKIKYIKGLKLPLMSVISNGGLRLFDSNTNKIDMVLEDCDFSNQSGAYAEYFYSTDWTSITLINTKLSPTTLQGTFSKMSNCTTIFSDTDYYKSGMNITDTFYQDYNLIGGSGSDFNTYGKSGKYAVIDKGSSNPGYLTKYEPANTYKLKTTINPSNALNNYKTTRNLISLTWKAYFNNLSEGYKFVKYTYITPNGNTSEGTSWIYNADKNEYIISGVFNEEEYGDYKLIITLQTPENVELTLNISGSGSVSGGGTIETGTTATAIATPNDGYIFKGWYKEVSTTQTSTLVSTSKIYKFRILEDTVLTAVFASNPYSPGGDSGTGGGDGSFDDTSDNPTSDNTTPSIPSSMMSIFVPTDTQFEELGNYLYGESAKGFFTNLVDTIGSLGTVKVSDYTINCYQCPVAITADGSKALELGWYPTSLTMNYTNKMGVVVSLGTVEVPNYYGNALDYKSRIQIYLPYIGYQDLDPAEVIGKTLNLSYKIEFITGDCVATITIDDKPMYQFKGNIAYRIPLSQDNFSDVIQQGISIGANAIGAGIAVGSAMTPLRTGTSMYNWAIEQANQGVIYPAQLETGSQLMNEGVENLPTAQMSLEQLQNKLSTAINTGTNVPHGSSAGGNTGWYMNQRPFIIIVRPRLSMPANYGHYHGYPSNITSRIGDLSGYTEFSAVHLEGLTATSNELSELEKVLKGGIRIGN